MATSQQVERLLQNKYMNVLAVKNKQIERIDQLDKNFTVRQPTFKNYIRNNATLYRTEAQN